jgi:hypothetical protein
VDTSTGVVGFAVTCTAKGICGKRAAMANTTKPQELEATFHTWKDALNTGDLNTFWQAIDERAEILDEDYP